MRRKERKYRCGTYIKICIISLSLFLMAAGIVVIQKINGIGLTVSAASQYDDCGVEKTNDIGLNVNAVHEAWNYDCGVEQINDIGLNVNAVNEAWNYGCEVEQINGIDLNVNTVNETRKYCTGLTVSAEGTENNTENKISGILQESLKEQASKDGQGKHKSKFSLWAEEWLAYDSLIRIFAGFIIGAVLFMLGIALHSIGKRRKWARTEKDFKEAENMKKREEMEITERMEECGSIAHPDYDGSTHKTAMLYQVQADMPLKTIGKVHHIGRRKNQQDTLGTAVTRMGLLAVVSDGMGGLSDGEKVSQQAVMGMMSAADKVSADSLENPLFEMLGQTNAQIRNMLGPARMYKSGATLLAVLVDGHRFHWISVGDSRIYLKCGHHILQLNSEHIYKRQLLLDAVNGKISFSKASTDVQRDRLISFLGMGDLKYVEGSLHPMNVEPGDRLLLMSDGIFHTISEDEILNILESTENAAQAAAQMERRVLEADNQKQDNFTCVILDF